MKILHVLCEGQTEEGFVNSVLRPYLLDNGFSAVKGILVSTNKKENAQGGMSSYTHVKEDISIMLRTNTDSTFEHHVFTTMFDFYALPNNFPGYDEAKKIENPYDCIKHLEYSFSVAIKDNRFIPYFQLHEFESLLFCGIDNLVKNYPKCEKNCEQLTKVLQEYGNPELINNNPSTAPSKRIINAIEGGKKQLYKYNKPATAKAVAGDIGIDVLRSKCPHFNEWIEQLIAK
jgi:hypothetical protein